MKMKKKAKKEKKEKKAYTTLEDSVEIAPELISTVNQLQSFVKKLPKCHTISSRLTATKNLLDIKNNELYQKFIELKGLYYLSSWLKEYKKSVVSGTDLTRDEEYIVKNIIHLCELIHLSINDLKTSKIGKNINSLGKALPEECSVKKYCEDIVSKWREMIQDNDNNEENNEDNCEENNESNFQQNNLVGGGGINNNNNQFLNTKTKRNNNSNSFSNNTNSNNINLNTNSNTSNKINSIKIKTYVKNSTNFFFSLLSKIKINVFFPKII
jgi:hypothetical protein